jgi:hypothetical protein
VEPPNPRDKLQNFEHRDVIKRGYFLVVVLFVSKDRTIVHYSGSGGMNSVDFVTEEGAELHAQRRAFIIVQHIRLRGVEYLLGCAPQCFGVYGSRQNLVLEPSGTRLINFFMRNLSSCLCMT